MVCYMACRQVQVSSGGRQREDAWDYRDEKRAGKRHEGRQQVLEERESFHRGERRGHRYSVQGGGSRRERGMHSSSMFIGRQGRRWSGMHAKESRQHRQAGWWCRHGHTCAWEGDT